MAKIIKLNSVVENRGSLTVIENVLPFNIKRVYYIYNLDNSIRGHHRHKKTIQAAVCVNGSCTISCQSGKGEEIVEYILSSRSDCLIINPEDYHTMYNFSKDAVLMVLASENYDSKDYIYEQY
jgi:dTDP-4-dehydrorhamnose 3,5-epimerase-like enzyme